jgi:hypothetical protein
MPLMQWQHGNGDHTRDLPHLKTQTGSGVTSALPRSVKPGTMEMGVIGEGRGLIPIP